MYAYQINIDTPVARARLPNDNNNQVSCVYKWHKKEDSRTALLL